MDTDSGAFIMEMQAKKIADNIMSYNGSQPCPQCGVIMNPTQVMYSKGMCSECYAQHTSKRLKDRMA